MCLRLSAPYFVSLRLQSKSEHSVSSPEVFLVESGPGPVDRRVRFP